MCQFCATLQRLTQRRMRHRQHHIDIANFATFKNVKQCSSLSTCARERSNCFTGVVLNHTHDEAKVTQDLFKLEFLESPDYFKPGLPYHGKVRHSACTCTCKYRTNKLSKTEHTYLPLQPVATASVRVHLPDNDVMYVTLCSSTAEREAHRRFAGSG